MTTENRWKHSPVLEELQCQVVRLGLSYDSDASILLKFNLSSFFLHEAGLISLRKYKVGRVARHRSDEAFRFAALVSD